MTLRDGITAAERAVWWRLVEAARLYVEHATQAHFRALERIRREAYRTPIPEPRNPEAMQPFRDLVSERGTLGELTLAADAVAVRLHDDPLVPAPAAAPPPYYLRD